MSIPSSFLKSGLLLLALTSLSSCLATPKDGDATLAFYQKRKTTTTATTGIEAFKDTYYTFARANCVSCHGVSQGPLFATADLNASYAAAKDSSYVNFALPASSKLAIYSGNGHCGMPNCQTNATVAAEAITAWAEVELAAANSGTGTGTGTGGTGTGGPGTGGAGATAIVTTSIPLPATLPTGTTYVPMRWNLSQVTPANALVAGAIFEIEVQRLSSTTYRVRYPKMVGLTAPVRITGMHVFVKPTGDPGIGVEDLGAGSVWERDIVTAQPIAAPVPLPATPLNAATYLPLDSFSMVIGIRSNQDSFTVAFDKLEAAVATAPTYASINSNILVPKCLSCHSTANPLGGKSYSTYAETIASGTASLLSSVSGGAAARMPIGSLKLTPAEVTSISDWINAGSPNN